MTRITKEELEDIINDYQNLSIRDIAKKYNRSMEGVRKALIRNGIIIRSTGEERLRKNNHIKMKDYQPTQFLGVYSKNEKYFVILNKTILANFSGEKDAAIFYNDYLLKNGIKGHLNNIS